MLPALFAVLFLSFFFFYRNSISFAQAGLDGDPPILSFPLLLG
jgi:hypothetical protein